MLFDADDIYVGRSLIELGQYSGEEVSLMCHLLEPGGVVVEAGAHIGTMTVPMARKCGTILAFEPQRLVFQMLCANLALNGIFNVRAFEQALGEADGQCLVPRPSGGMSNTGGVTLKGVTEGDPVVCRSIDSLALPRLDLLKADVEAMEIEVLRGARKTITAFRPLLYLESANDHEPLFAELESLGYDAYWHFPTLLVEQRNLIDTMIVSINVLCYPKERTNRSVGLELARTGDQALEVFDRQRLLAQAVA
jgi:FkbM family methyltransferase